jgi:hypothetical protein
MRVIATARGYDNITTREIGDEFDMPDDAKGSWFAPKDAPVKSSKEDKPKAGKQSKTPSEAAKGDTSEVQADLA